MIAPRFFLKPLALAALAFAGTTAQAALTVYTSAADFASATAAPGVDTFSGLSISGTTPSPLVRIAGAYGYTATASTGDFYGAGTTGNPWLTTDFNLDSITFDSFGPAIGAIGGNFFASNISGAFVAGDVTLTATDSLGATSTQVISGASVTSFLGFVSTGNISSLVVTSLPGASATPWPTIDNLTLAVAVPEPATYAMLLAGLASLGFITRRRRGG